MQRVNDGVSQSNLSWNLQRWMILSSITSIGATILVVFILAAWGFSEQFSKYNIVVISACLGLVIGSTLGAVQASILRNILRPTWLWFVATLAGWLCGAILFGMVLSNPSLPTVGLAIFGVPIVLATFFQWLIIRRSFPRSSRWVGINIGASILILFLGFFSGIILASLIVLSEFIKAFTIDKLFKSSAGL